MEQLPLFLYGTLCHGERNRHLIADAVERSLPGTVRGSLQLRLDDNYPYPCLIEGTDRVGGELVYLTSQRYRVLLQVIDELEEYDPRSDSGLYLRRRIRVDSAEGQVSAWTYLWNGALPAGPTMAGGDFQRWSRRSRAAGAP